MSLPKVVNRNGRPIALDQQMGQGGEGTVYSLLDDRGSVAKVYDSRSLPAAEKAEKLAVLIGMATDKLRSVVKWPSELIYDAGTRQPVGFVMPRIESECREIWLLYNPVQRLKNFPKADWAFQVRAASNLAAAFDEVHKSGCVIADVQLKNAWVSPQAIVWLIDCDSFQIRANGKNYLCDVGLPHYTPPELQGTSLRGVVRTPNHDSFGLAVLIYQLLFVGRHPYAGVYTGPGDPSFEQLISEFRFSQGPNAAKWGMAPPPFTPVFTDIPAELGVLFRRAFERGGEKGTRPKPAEWIAALRLLENQIATCRSDKGHKYWRGNNNCIWCRISTQGGPEYYYGASGDMVTFSSNKSRIDEVLTRLSRYENVQFTYRQSDFTNSHIPEARPLPHHITEALNKWTMAAERSKIERLTSAKAINPEIESAEQNESELMKEYLAQRDTDLSEIEELISSEKSIRNEDSREKRIVYKSLGSATIAGIALMPFGAFHYWLALIGLTIFATSSILIFLYYTYKKINGHSFNISQLRRRQQAIISKTNRKIHFLRKTTSQIKKNIFKKTESVNKTYENYAETLKVEFLRLLKIEIDKRETAVRTAEDKFLEQELKWKNISNSFQNDKARLAHAVRQKIAEHKTLDGLFNQELILLKKNAELSAQKSFLSLHYIADANIEQIGEERKRTLARHSVISAADISYNSIVRIDGFGDSLAKKLLSWRHSVLIKFDAKSTLPITAKLQQSLAAKYQKIEISLLLDLDKLIFDMESLSKRTWSETLSVSNEIKLHYYNLQVAVADLQSAKQLIF